MLLPLIVLAPVLVQTPAATGPAQQPAFHDELLDQMVGLWNLTGEVRGQPVRETVFVQWAIDHQFLMIHRKQVEGPHESFTYIGYDNVSDRYVMHQLDSFGGRGSETLGYGVRTGDKIQFVFEYPSGPYHDTLSWDAKEKTWQFLLEFKDRQGHWTPFSISTLRHARGRGPQ